MVSGLSDFAFTNNSYIYGNFVAWAPEWRLRTVWIWIGIQYVLYFKDSSCEWTRNMEYKIDAGQNKGIYLSMSFPRGSYCLWNDEPTKYSLILASTRLKSTHRKIGRCLVHTTNLMARIYRNRLLYANTVGSILWDWHEYNQNNIFFSSSSKMSLAQASGKTG